MTRFISHLASKTEIPTKVSQLANDEGYLTSIPSEYVTETELDTAIKSVDVTEQLKDYAKKIEIPTKTSQLTNDSGYITSIPSEYITETELNKIIGNINYDSVLSFDTSEIVFKISSDNDSISAILGAGVLGKLKLGYE